MAAQNLDDVRDHVIEALGNVQRAIRYRGSAARAPKAQRAEITKRLVRELRDASSLLHTADLLVRQDIEEETRNA